ncbi:MAG: hypothetical protein ACOC41_02510 [Chitinivibrionales bacterium]
MKKLLMSIAISAIAFGASAQDVVQGAPDYEELRNQIQQEIQGELDNLPDAVQTQLAEAKGEVEKVREQLQNMRLQGSTPEEMEAFLQQNRERAEAQLQRALERMEGVNDQVRARVEQAKADIQQRLEEKTAEMRQRREQIQQRIDAQRNQAGN